MGSSLQKVLLVYLLSILSLCHSLEIDLTADIAAGYKECFFQNIKKVVGMEVEYQVKTKPTRTKYYKTCMDYKQMLQLKSSNQRTTSLCAHFKICLIIYFTNVNI